MSLVGWPTLLRLPHASALDYLASALGLLDPPPDAAKEAVLSA
jgi:hypothetical protein